MEKAQKLYESILAQGPGATRKEAVAARNAMFAAKAQVKDAPKVGSQTPRERDENAMAAMLGRRSDRTAKGDSFSDILGRAVTSEQAAAEALEGREYGPARTLFRQAEKLYLKKAALQVERQKAFVAQKSAENARKFSDGAFKTEARQAGAGRREQGFRRGGLRCRQ